MPYTSSVVLALALLLLPPSLAGAGATPAESDGGFEAPRRDRGERRQGRGIEGLLERHGDRLGLDEATRARIREVSAGARAEGEDLRQRLRTLQKEMRRLLEQDVPEEETVMRQAERVGEAETEMQKHRLRTMLRIRTLLTPEQRRELVRIYAEMREEGKPRRRPFRPERGRGAD